MKDSDFIAEVHTQTARENRCQSNFRNQHHGAAIHFNRRLHPPNVNFSFAAPGDSVQQDRREYLRLQWIVDRTQSFGLRLRQSEILSGRKFRVDQRIAPQFLFKFGYQAFLQKSPDH